MNPLFPRMSEAIAGRAWGLMLTLGLYTMASACEPKNDVKAGAPVLLGLSIIEADGTRTDVTAETADCDATTVEGGDCDPSSSPCRLSSTTPPTTSICHCVGKPEGDC